ncbi:MAG: HlyD family secretion protein, partial [Candidatus Korobacteraceae bacterium]
MKGKVLVVVAILAVAAAAVLGTRAWKNTDAEGLIASGTLEARNISVGSKVGGRITKVLVREGDHVQAGELLVTFDEAELEAQRMQAQGRLEQARANLKKLERGSRPEEIAQARAATAAGERAVAQARSELKRAQAEARNAEQDFRRRDNLYPQGVVSRQERDDAEARFDSAIAQVRALESAVEAEESRVQAARANQRLVEEGPRS